MVKKEEWLSSVSCKVTGEIPSLSGWRNSLLTRRTLAIKILPNVIRLSRVLLRTLQLSDSDITRRTLQNCTNVSHLFTCFDSDRVNKNQSGGTRLTKPQSDRFRPHQIQWLCVRSTFVVRGYRSVKPFCCANYDQLLISGTNLPTRFIRRIRWSVILTSFSRRHFSTFILTCFAIHYSFTISFQTQIYLIDKSFLRWTVLIPYRTEVTDLDVAIIFFIFLVSFS